jgi:hypothetical protein
MARRSKVHARRIPGRSKAVRVARKAAKKNASALRTLADK